MNTEKEYDVVALGELLIDFTNNGISSQGNTIMEVNPGGAPCNVLSMLNKLDRRTAFIGKVGDDMFGHMLADTVKEQGIDISGISFDTTVNTTLAFVHTKSNGDRSFSFYRNPGADMMLRVADVDTDIVKNTKIFHCGTLSMTDKEVRDATKYAVDTAVGAGALISFDPNYRPLLWDDPNQAKEAMWYGIGVCDILKISDDEIEFLTGKNDIDEGIAVIRKKSSARLICATMGANGSIAYYGDIRVSVPAFVAGKVIETTGAGDTFMGCLLDGVLDKGLNNLSSDVLTQILRFANEAASIVTTRRGALKVMPTRVEVENVIIREKI